MYSTLHVQLLGGFCLAEDEETIRVVNSTAPIGLLAYLLLNRQSPHSRQQISFLLWPDSSEKQAQANLRTLLARLRRAWPEVERFLQIDHRVLQWRADAPFSLDVIEFETATLRVESFLISNPLAAQTELERAIRLYQGDLLPDCYDNWIVPERERLRQIFLKALRQLIELLEKRSEFANALGYAQRLLQLEPLEETTYQQIMRLHALRGDRPGIIRVFDTCTAVLQQELMIGPSATTCQIYKSLLHLEPPAVTVAAAHPTNHNLPCLLTRFIGREREIAELEQLILPTSVEPTLTKGRKTLAFRARLMTLSGMGGNGKTRLALQVASAVMAQYPDGVWWIDLAPLTDPTLVSRAAASILEVPEQPDHSLIETLSNALSSRRLLLIMDNCEHLVAECARFASHLITRCPNLTIIATSQEALGLAGETVYQVPPLSLPSTPEINSIDQAESVQLFVERATLALPTFTLTAQNRAAVVKICRRLDGIPLAIELAATRMKALAVETIAARLDDRFNLLLSHDRAGLPRHQTLRAMVDWSYDLLADPEQALLRQLSVFLGGFTLEAAEAVGGAATEQPNSVLENLSRLIDKSLVVAEVMADESMRYRMLETIQQYALEKLRAANELRSACELHSIFFARLVEEADLANLNTAVRLRRWFTQLESDYDNLRTAFNWWIDSDQTEMALRFSGHLGWFWVIRSEFIEGRQWIGRALALPNASQYPRTYARALVFVGILAFLQTEEKEAKPWLEQALIIARAQADRLTVADALDFLGLVALRQRDLALARACLEESQALFRDLGDWTGQARTLWHLGFVAERTEDTAAVLNLYEQALTLLREWGDPLRQSAVLRSIGWNHYELGDRVNGQKAYRESLTLVQSIGHKAGIAHTLRAIAERIQSDPARAVRLLRAVSNLYRSIGSTTYEQAVRTTDLVQRQAQLDEALFAQASEAGNALTTEQAIEDALRVE